MVSPPELDALLSLSTISALMLVISLRVPGVCASLAFVTAVLGLACEKAQGALCAGKGALELAREGIQVNSVAPAIVRTEM